MAAAPKFYHVDHERTTMRFAILALALLCAACSTADPATMLQAMGQDPASVCVHIGASIYTPAVDIVRVNREGVAANCGSVTLTTVPTPGTGTATIAFPGQLTVKPQ